MSTLVVPRIRSRAHDSWTGERLKLCLDNYSEIERLRLNNEPLRPVILHVEKVSRENWPEDFAGEVAYSKGRTKSNKASKLRPVDVPKPMLEVSIASHCMSATLTIT